MTTSAKVILLIALVVLVVGAKKRRHVRSVPVPDTAKRAILSWLIVAALASLLGWIIYDEPKGERLSSVATVVAGIAAIEGLRWIVRKVEPPIDSDK